MPENIITIDGRQFYFDGEETILEVARRNGVFIPTLCHIRGARPTGACRVCVVEVKGARSLLPACATPAADKMVVHTHSPAVMEARKTILALLLQSGNHNCAIATNKSQDWTEFQRRVEDYDQGAELCPAHSACNLQAYSYRYQVDTRGFIRVETNYPMEMASPLIIRDFSRCILCGRCVEACNTIQVNNAITHGFRGAKAKIITMGDNTLHRSDCVFCGECIQACPVAALTERKSRYEIRPWEARHVRTTCHFCGVGCQLDLHIKDDKIMKVTGVERALPNQGRLCVKGRFGYDFIQSPDRLTVPMIRENGELRDASWDEALNLIASKIKEVKEKHGPDAIAGICSAKSTNEALYLMQKLFRTAIGTNNLASPFAAGGLNNTLAELEKAGRIILIGSDITEENPVAGTFIKRAAKNGAQLIVADSRPTKISSLATVSLLLREGTESILVNGIIKELLDRGREAADDIRETAVSFTMDTVSEMTGLSAEDIRGVARILDSEEPTMLVYGSRVASFARTFVSLQEVLGNLGRECGGVNYMGDLNNSQGACDVGFLPAFLPGYTMVDDDAARKPFEEAWGVELDDRPGLTFAQMVLNMSGSPDTSGKKIRMLYCVGENLAIARPAMPDITKALESVDFLVLQDILDSETVRYADVVLPAAAWSEEEGTYTNCERRVSRMRRAVPSPGEAKPEIWIFTQLANRLGCGWKTATSQEIWEKEIIPLIPFLKDITYDRIETGGLPWPLPDPVSLGITSFRDVKSPLRRPGWTSFNYHHRTLLEQCPGLLESIPHTIRVEEYQPPGDPPEVREKFMQFLKEEEKPEAKEQIDHILASYKDHRGGLIPVLQQVQGILGFLPIPVQHYIALGLGLPSSDVFGVVSFYSFFTMVPRGRHIVRVCLGTACFVKGSGKLLDTLGRHLKVDVGETTSDREYSLEVVRCIGACGLAPVMVIDEETHGMVDPSKIVALVESVRGKE
ncbi:MAG: molybdopterin-dependent oxidoreductase [Desulfobacterales bacterium]|nr:molybdopterin-dependent oxidoreductase [Desulfobacterales bacterium]MBL7101132.1 molybdopterin-dependent oxidoreductase [Desulfobacteraceae bacterium]MBL7171442.1 molybdopterin-dependent oxidoreductase [Desulfobacteraceae bacterium]